jgi:hypothetical protein
LSLFDFGHARFGLRLKLARLALGRGGSRLCTSRFSGLCFAAGSPGHVVFVGCYRFMVADKFHSFLTGASVSAFLASIPEGLPALPQLPTVAPLRA